MSGKLESAELLWADNVLGEVNTFGSKFLQSPLVEDDAGDSSTLVLCSVYFI